MSQLRERKRITTDVAAAYPPRAMRALEAAAYLAMSKASFLRLVEDGVMPTPIRIKGLVMWDRHDLDDAFEEWKRKSVAQSNSMDELLGVTADGEDSEGQ